MRTTLLWPGTGTAQNRRALHPKERRDVDVWFGNALADPAVLNRPRPDAGDPLLVQLIVEERVVVGDDDEIGVVLQYVARCDDDVVLRCETNSVSVFSAKRGRAARERAEFADGAEYVKS